MKKKLFAKSCFLKILIAGLVSFLFPACQTCERGEFPPSNYIGIFDVYQSYENGRIPSIAANYTGFWRYKDPGGNILKGAYFNGAPYGCWQSISQEGIVETRAI